MVLTVVSKFRPHSVFEKSYCFCLSLSLSLSLSVALLSSLAFFSLSLSSLSLSLSLLSLSLSLSLLSLSLSRSVLGGTFNRGLPGCAVYEYLFCPDPDLKHHHADVFSKSPFQIDPYQVVDTDSYPSNQAQLVAKRQRSECRTWRGHRRGEGVGWRGAVVCMTSERHEEEPHNTYCINELKETDLI